MAWIWHFWRYACSQDFLISLAKLPCSEPVLPLAQFREDRDGIGAGHAEFRLDRGVVGAKKRIRRKLDRDRGGKGKFASLAQPGGLLGPLFQDPVGRINRQRETCICKSVFMPAINLRFGGKRCKFHE